MTTASGTHTVPFARQAVWRSLTTRTPYCSVCDVSYVFSEDPEGAVGDTLATGTTFVCVQGRLEGAPPPDAVRGEVVECVPQQCIGTRLDLEAETWRTRIELADAGAESTRVTVTVTHEATGSRRLLPSRGRKAMQRMVQQTVDSELAKLSGHIGGAPVEVGEPEPVVRGVCSVEQEPGGWVVHLRGEVDAPALGRLDLRRRLEELPVLAIDVRELTYIDSSAFPPIRRWARRSTQAGGRPVVRGDNEYFDSMLTVMGLTSVFARTR